MPLWKRRPAAGRRRIRKLRLFAALVVLGLLGSAAFTLGLVAAIASEIPSLDPARQQARELNGVIYASDGSSVLAVLRGSESRVLVKPDEISARMKSAIVAIEDRRFWEHRGVDLRGIARALWADVRQQRVVEGGSTITQQYVKNVYGENTQSIGRKVREAALAWQLERDARWSKERILTEYLNTIYFGNGAYGIQQAARAYFDESARDLKLAEAALLAGIPADPTGYDPVTRPAAARQRRTQVLDAMLEVGAITPGEHENALRAPLPSREDVRLPGTEITWRAPYFTNYVKQQLIERRGARDVFGGGLRVTTTIDLELQNRAREAIAKWLDDPDGPQAALVALDPTTGNVLAMVGGRSYRESQFNLAVQSERQPGSAFKPFVLATALEQGIAPATTFDSKPLQVFLGDRYVQISNYDDAYLGSADLTTATIHSDNSVYTQLTQLVGPKRVARTAKKLGVTSDLQGYLSIGLGGEAVNPLELARAFAAFANGGVRIDQSAPKLANRPRVIEEIANAEGDVIDANVQTSHTVLQPRTVAIVNNALERVVEEGTGRRARLSRWPAAGKTGTTENYGDAWFVGYTTNLVVAVWVGYPANLTPMLTEYDGDAVAGGTYPALIWKTFMERALPEMERARRYSANRPEPFDAPPYDAVAPQLVVERDGVVQRDNGLCRESREIVYFVGFGPRRTADCKLNEVDVPRVVGLTLGEARDRLAQQPLEATVIYKPARALQRTDVVLGQIPVRGRLSSFDEVTLVLGKPLHGLVPDVKGSTLAQARQTLDRRKLRTMVTRFSDGPPGQVVSQSPPPGVAAAPGMTVKLVVARSASPRAAGE